MPAPPHANAAAIRRALGADVASLPWHLPPLSDARARGRPPGRRRLGRRRERRPAFVGSARFGPLQLPTDVDVAVNLEAHVASSCCARWSGPPRTSAGPALPRQTRLLQRHGLATSSAAQAKRLATFLHRTFPGAPARRRRRAPAARRGFRRACARAPWRSTRRRTVASASRNPPPAARPGGLPKPAGGAADGEPALRLPPLEERTAPRS